MTANPPCPNCGGPTIDDGWTPVFCGKCGNIDKYEGRYEVPTRCPHCHSLHILYRHADYLCAECMEAFALEEKRSVDHDPVNHPRHYMDHNGSGIECIEISRELGFDLGNAFKYVWRHEHKDGVVALEKALWYINDAWDRRPHPIDPWISDRMALVLVHEIDADKGLALYYIMRAVCYPTEYGTSLEKARDTIRRMIDAYTQSG